MFFNRRKKYNGKVAELLPFFGFDLDDAGVLKTLDALDIAWKQKYNEYEGALFISYLVFFGYHKLGDPKAQVVLEKLNVIENEWLRTGLVKHQLTSRFRLKLDNYLTTTKNEDQKVERFEFLPNMPDIMSKEPVKAFTCGEHLAVLVESVNTIGENHYNLASPLRYTFALALLNSHTNQPMLMITLETGITDGQFLGMFDDKGQRYNLGKAVDVSQAAFLDVALDKVATKLGVSVESIVCVS